MLSLSRVYKVHVHYSSRLLVYDAVCTGGCLLRYRDTLRLWKICVDERKLHPTDISINRRQRLARCIYVCILYHSL